MQVVTKVNESQVAGIRRGMKATVRVHAFPEQLFNGVVVEIAPLPDSLPSDSAAKVYTTKVLINGAIPGLRPACRRGSNS